MDELIQESSKRNYKIHYALKANSNDRILKIISGYGLGADCVSGNEINKAISTGFRNDEIVLQELKNLTKKSGQLLQTISPALKWNQLKSWK